MKVMHENNNPTLSNSEEILSGLFKLSYVTADLDRYADRFFSIFGIEEYYRSAPHQLSVSMSVLADVQICCAWSGGVLIELIQPLHDPDNYYTTSCVHGEVAQLHHLSRLFSSESEVQQTIQHYRHKGFPVEVLPGSNGRVFQANFQALLTHRIEGVLRNDALDAELRAYPRAKNSKRIELDDVISIPPFPGFYQFTYITNDFDRTIKLFADIYGISDFMELRPLEVAMRDGKPARMNCALAYVGAMEIEIMNPLDGDVSIYTDMFEGEEFQVRHHHLSRLFQSFDDYEQRVNEFQVMGKTLLANNNPGQTDVSRFYYVDYRKDVGHYLESSIFDRQIREWIETFPRFN